ncbi:ion channel [Aciduricibacillus chroicocephali]|uniref:Ion channel n=1 Tax=Aciduricibacillus chroicocephali TaxID=3054939 RepID=A0ABY9KU70_9BACI|nr:ion channel [Bacillaceae bacterium 44XB]
MHKKIKIFYEIILFTLAFISILTIFKTNIFTQILDKIIWLVFFIDVLTGFIKSKHKGKYILQHPIEIIAAMPLDSMFQSARIIRALRLLRFFTVGKRYFGPLRRIFETNGLNNLLSVSAFTLLGASILVTYFEPAIDTYEDGLWWSIVTTTTVGYGDLSPKTPAGRLIAVILMLVGIGIIGTLTSSITTYFIHDPVEKNPTIQFLQSELKRYEELTDAEKNRLELILHDLNTESAKNTGKDSPP